MENKIFEESYLYLYYICNSKTIKICPNQHADLLRFLFTEDSLKIEKGVELVLHFFDKKFSFIIWHKLAKFHNLNRLCLLLKCSVKCVSCFILTHLMTSRHLNIWKVKIWLSQERFRSEVKIFFLFSQVLSFWLKKQTSKNIVITTFTRKLQHYFQMKKRAKEGDFDRLFTFMSL